MDWIRNTRPNQRTGQRSQYANEGTDKVQLADKRSGSVLPDLAPIRSRCWWKTEAFRLRWQNAMVRPRRLFLLRSRRTQDCGSCGRGPYRHIGRLTLMPSQRYESLRKFSRLKRLRSGFRSNVGLGGCGPPQPLKPLKTLRFRGLFILVRWPVWQAGKLLANILIRMGGDACAAPTMYCRVLPAMWVSVPSGRADANERRLCAAAMHGDRLSGEANLGPTEQCHRLPESVLAGDKHG